MRNLEAKIDAEIGKPFWSSGHAFVCFDSINSVRIILEKFRFSPISALKIGLMTVQDKAKMALAPSRERNVSTFDKFYDVDQEFAEGSRGHDVLISKLASEPIDINWKNMGGTRGIYFFRRIFVLLISIVILLFVTTPTAMLSSIRQLDFFHIFTFQWVETLPFGQFIKAHLPPLIILGVNQILLFLIDIASLLEKHETFSDYHSSVYAKSAIYLTLNMLVIPALTLTNSEPLINILSKKNFNIAQFLGDFYIANSGIFFVSILIQQACLSSSFYLNNGSEFFLSYFSPWLA